MQGIKFGPAKNTTVCKDCTIETGRSPSCHSTCEKYLKEVEERKAATEEIRKIRQQQTLPDKVIIAGKQKRKKAANIVYNYKITNNS